MKGRERSQPSNVSDDQSRDLQEALLQIEARLCITPPAGLASLQLKSRFRAVILEIKSRICPNRSKLRASLESDGGDLATIIFDALITNLSGIPLPVTTLAKRIAFIGLERFCMRPESILEW